MNRNRLAWLGALVGMLVGVAIVAIRFYFEPAITTPPVSLRFIETVWKPVWETKTSADGRVYSVLHFVSEQRTSSQGFEIKPWNELVGNLGRAGKLDQILTLVETTSDDAVRADLITAVAPVLDSFARIQVQDVWQTKIPPKLNELELKAKKEQFHEYLTKDTKHRSDSPDDPSTDVPAPPAPEPAPAATDGASNQLPTDQPPKVDVADKSGNSVATRNSDDAIVRNINNDAPIELRINEAENYYRYLDSLLKQTEKLTPPSLRSRTFAITANSLFDLGLDEKAANVVQLAQVAAQKSDRAAWAWMLPMVLAILGFVATTISSPFLEAMGKRIGRSVAHATGATEVQKILKQK